MCALAPGEGAVSILFSRMSRGSGGDVCRIEVKYHCCFELMNGDGVASSFGNNLTGVFCLMSCSYGPRVCLFPLVPSAGKEVMKQG